jgi:hypothetical protein
MLVRACVVGALMASALSRTANALDQGEWQAGVTANLTGGPNGKGISLGGGGRLEGRYGITDALSAWGAVGSLWWSADGIPLRASSASAGMTLAFDVVRWVPFVELGLAVADVGSPSHIGRTYVGGELGAGAEYLLDRRWSLAAVARVAWFPQRLSRPSGNSTLAVGLRLASTF